ncbi:MAG: hypothetical protein D6736_14345 [Nitrospinota bacterium]|nr:MAG: hypothetical protein D6736_14345 [Nitrospinota bacterium]
MAIAYMELVKEQYVGFPDYRWSVYDSSPWTPLTKPLRDCRVALISSGGVYHKTQPPFNPEKNDLTFREIPKAVDPAELLISHDHYDHTDAEKDINCIFPIERFRELEAEGIIGSLADPNYTFMGRIFKRTALREEMTPALIAKLKAQEVDVLFLVPA